MFPVSTSVPLSSELFDWLPSEGMLREVFEVSLTGLVFYRPILDPATGELVDFAFVQLNPAAQHILGLAAQPGPAVTLLQQFPSCRQNGAFTFQQHVFLSGEAGSFELNYQEDGFDNYFKARAQRVGPGLLVSFTDTADQPRTAVEIALRESQAREQAARLEAEAQRSQIQHLFQQAPACIASLTGPEHTFTMVNPRYQQLFSGRPLLGKPIREALPELEGQPFFDLITEVYHTGETYHGNEVLAYVDTTNSGRLDPVYFNFIYQATYDATDTINGVLIFAYDVSEQVWSRQAVELQEQQANNFNEELAAANEELLASYEEIRQNHYELVKTQHALEVLNQELDDQVQTRTQEARTAQAEVELQRGRLEQLFMQAPAAICILDGPELVFELVNPSYQQLFPGRQLQGRRIADAMPEITEHDVLATLHRVFETGIAHEEKAMLIPFAQPNGVWENRYFNYIQQARYNAAGRIDGILVFAFEVTEQVTARQVSEDSARQLRLLTDALPVLIGYLDREQKYQFANHAYESWFQQNPAALLGQHVWEVIGDEAYQGVKNYIERALAGERLDFQARMPYRQDFTKHIRTSYVPDTQDGQVAGFYTLVTDITEQVEARQEVERLNDRLVAMNEDLRAINQQLVAANVDLDNFIYTASHDLKAPITNIEGLLQTLLSELPTTCQVGEVAYILELMQGAVDRFKRTIEHLTDVSRLQKEHTQPTMQVQLAEVIEDVRLDLAPLLLETNAQLDIQVEDCPSMAFSGKNLRSIVYNLLSNALKYHHPSRPPQVRVRCRTEQEYLVLEVQDNGLGLDLARTQQLFQMFQRYHTHVEGSGIGLYMVKRMIENAGGRIRVDSRLGEGSTFSVYFRR